MSRYQVFKDLHQAGCFVMPNPWDIGSAKLMAAKGAVALATTSAGHAFTLGKPDMGYVTRDEALLHAAEIVAATPLPVNGDLENGYGDAPEVVAETIYLAAEAGLSGASIEDTTMQADTPSYPFELAVERVAAGAKAARDLGRPFMFTARADGVMIGAYDMDEALRRAQAFAAAGADVIYVPIPQSMDDIARLCAAVELPVNGLAAGPYLQHTAADFAAAGVRRISLGSAIARATHRVMDDALGAMLDSGSFAPLQHSISGDKIDKMLT
ncbi:MAG TPA: isocitrate lyase/phosphoenolpyruvate mutase family protein [Rhodobacteraceae bacterium]|nr:isocitrate lyase/phosphoenolpyruvate mutase family protein [Paracoccaceae bacterium]